MSDLSREEAFAALRWLVEAGADETVGEHAVNRLLARASAPAAAPGPVLPPAPLLRAAIVSPAPPPVPPVPPRSVEAADHLAQSCNSLAELQTALASFDGCELKRHATKLVFADGNPAGGVMFIGEAPGQEEDRQGLPFVGRAGQLLDRMLGAINLDRSKVYITNIVYWRPPSNREPTPEEAAVCLPFLHRHIELADPKVLVLLGAVPVRRLLGMEGILRLRGRWETWRPPGTKRETPVMLTLHPAYLLRQPAAKRLAWQDFLSLANKIESLGLA